MKNRVLLNLTFSKMVLFGVPSDLADGRKTVSIGNFDFTKWGGQRNQFRILILFWLLFASKFQNH